MKHRQFTTDSSLWPLTLRLRLQLLRKKQKLNQPLKEESTTIRLKSADEKVKRHHPLYTLRSPDLWIERAIQHPLPLYPVSSWQATFLLAQITASASLSKLECEEYKLATSHFEVFAKADATDRLEQASATVKKFTKNQGKGKVQDLHCSLLPPTTTAIPAFQHTVDLSGVLRVVQAKGSPRILVVCGGALRAVDVARAFVPLQCGVSKLFAKHIKEAEQAEYLRESTALVAVGTPHRLHRLSALGALKLDQLVRNNLFATAHNCCPILCRYWAADYSSRVQFWLPDASPQALLVIDMEPDVKGSTLFDQQQIRENLVHRGCPALPPARPCSVLLTACSGANLLTAGDHGR